MESDREPTVTRVPQAQHVMYVMPHDWTSIAHFLAPMLERVADDVADVQALVVTADAEAAAAVAAAAVRLVGERELTVLAATSSRRALRLLRIAPAQIVAGPPDVLLSLVQGAALKLENVRAVAVAWLDELLAGGAEQQLETLLGEVPKDAVRSIVASSVTPTVEALVERYARRARRVAPAAGESASSTPLEYVAVSAFTRTPILRRLLDDLDPERALVYVREDDSEREVRSLIRALGYPAGARAGDEAAAVRVARAGGAEEPLVILYDLPASRQELGEAVGAQPRRVIALVQPRQMTSLRALAGGATVTPLSMPDAATRARAREQTLRDQLRDTLATGHFARELLALEPLLADYDGIEIAAAAVSLLERERLERERAERERTERAPRSGAGSGEQRAAPPSATTRLFLTIGSMDGVRPGDLVGAITNEAGITGAQLGRIEIRDTHSLVEVASDVAEAVASKLTGIVVRGRRVVARVDQERPARAPRGDRPRGDRPRGDRPGGDRPRGDRPRGDRPRNDRPRGEGRPGRGGARGDTADEGRRRGARPPRENE